MATSAAHLVERRCEEILFLWWQYLDRLWDWMPAEVVVTVKYSQRCIHTHTHSGLERKQKWSQPDERGRRVSVGGIKESMIDIDAGDVD